MVIEFFYLEGNIYFYLFVLLWLYRYLRRFCLYYRYLVFLLNIMKINRLIFKYVDNYEYYVCILDIWFFLIFNKIVNI